MGGRREASEVIGWMMALSLCVVLFVGSVAEKGEMTL